MVAILLWVASIANTQTSSFPGGTLVRMDLFPHALTAFSDSARSIACTKDVWAQITNASNNLFTNDYGENITHAGDTLTVEQAGDYYVNFNLSWQGNNGEQWKLGLLKNGVLWGYTANRYTSNNDIGNASIQAYIDDAVIGDDIKPVIMNLTDSDDPTVISSTLWMVWQFD